MGLFNNEPVQQGGSLNLAMSGAPVQQVGFNGMQANPWGVQAQVRPVGGSFGGGLSSAFGVQQPQQMAPPNETEILVALLNANSPMERWLVTPGFQSFVQMLSSMMELAVVEFFRHAQFGIDEESGVMALDSTSLPSHLQTVSSENIITDYNAVQATANQNIQQTLNQQQQILALAQQSLMQSAFGAAMGDPGLLERAGSGIGGIARGLIGLPAPARGM